MKYIIDILEGYIKNKTYKLKEIYTFTHTVLVKSKNMGISSQWLGFPWEVPECQRYPVYDFLIGMDVYRAFNILIDGSPIEVSMAMACFNSTVDIPTNANEGNVFDLIYPYCKGRNIVFIGHFPRANKWRMEGLNVNIVELIPREEDIDWRESADILNKADIVFITGIALLNDTIEMIIDRTKHAMFRILMGPTVPVIPELFNIGVHIIGGTFIIKEREAVCYWQRGGAGARKAPKGCLKSVYISNIKYV